MASHISSPILTATSHLPRPPGSPSATRGLTPDGNVLLPATSFHRFNGWRQTRRRRSFSRLVTPSMSPKNKLADGNQNFGNDQNYDRRLEPGRCVGVDHIGEGSGGLDDRIEFVF